jgi:hypothetical protein
VWAYAIGSLIEEVDKIINSLSGDATKTEDAGMVAA